MKKIKFNVKKLSKKQIILIAVAAVLLIVLVPSGIYCGVNKESPKQMLTDMFSSNENQIIGKWQNDLTPGLSAYEFFDDGTYTNYLSTYTFTGDYSIEGNKLTLSNPNSGGSVVYKFSINGDKMTLKLQDKGEDSALNHENTFQRVDHLNMKTLTDIIEDLATTKENKE